MLCILGCAVAVAVAKSLSRMGKKRIDDLYAPCRGAIQAAILAALMSECTEFRGVAAARIEAMRSANGLVGTVLLDAGEWQLWNAAHYPVPLYIELLLAIEVRAAHFF